MTDPIALLALSQLICLGAIAYLYCKTLGLARRIDSGSKHRTAAGSPFETTALRNPNSPAVAIDSTTFVPGLEVDIPALARRMHRSEDEVRALLRSRGARP